MDAEPVVIGCLMTEGGGWKEALGADAALIRTLGAMPLFHPDGHGGLVEDWGYAARSDRALSRRQTLVAQELLLLVGLQPHALPSQHQVDELRPRPSRRTR